MEWTQMIGACLLTAVLVVVLKPLNPAMSGLVCASLGVMLLGALLPQVYQYVNVVRQFLNGAGLGDEYYATMLKAMGIVVVTQIAEQVCCDMGAHEVAERVEMCGRITMLGIAIPLFIDLTQMAVDVLR